MRSGLACAVAAVALAGCGDAVMDAGEMETKIAESVASQTDQKASELKVACPEGEPAEKGHKFDCSLTGSDGSEAKVNVTVSNSDGDFTYFVPPQYDAAQVEQQLVTQLAPQGGFEPTEITAECPDDVTIEKGGKFDCTLQLPGGKTAPVNVTFKDERGQFDAIVPPGHGFGGNKLFADQLEAELAKQLAPQAGVDPADVSVACPANQPARKGHRFDCTLTAPNGDKVKVNVRLTNNKGGFKASVPPGQ